MFRKCFLMATLFAAIPSFGQNSHANEAVEHNYLVVKLDNNWDNITDNGALKTKDIEIPTCDWKEKDVTFDAAVWKALDIEVRNQLTSLDARYKEEGFPAVPKTALSIQKVYSSRDITYALFKHKVNFEETEILSILIIDQDSISVFSQSNKFGEEVTIFCGDKRNNEYLIYGHQKGNPDTHWSGNFVLKFSDFKRILEYSTYEING